jgi:hypothetical protein
VQGGRVLAGYEYTSAAGPRFLHQDDEVARLSSPSGQQIVLLARSLFHIKQTHQADALGSRFIDEISPIDLLGELGVRLPAEVVYSQREARLEFRCERLVGVDIVDTRPALRARGCITRATDVELESLRDEVFRLNLFGSAERKRELVARVNERLAGTRASLGFRRHSIVIQVDAEPTPTEWFSVAIYCDSHRARTAGAVGEIRTMYPGRVREPWPCGQWFFKHYGADRPSRGLAILDRLREGLPIERAYQRRAVLAQSRAQRYWWEHAILRPDPSG